MGIETIMFGDIETEKHKFCCYKSPISYENVDIGNVLVSDKIYSNEKKQTINTLLVTCMIIMKLSNYI